MSRTGCFCTSFCNKGHALADGKPVGHECYVLNPAALQAEARGQLDLSLPVHFGVIHRGKKPRAA